MSTILLPSKAGYSPAKCMFTLWACKVSCLWLGTKLWLTVTSLFYSFSRCLTFLNCWLPKVACPKCSYVNDEFYSVLSTVWLCTKRCPRTSNKLEGLLLIKVDESEISECLAQLSQQRGSSCYVKQKTMLKWGFVNFISHLATPEALASALSADVIAFLVWKDRGSKTCVHLPGCHNLSNQVVSVSSCKYPKRLASGTVDALIGKLWAIVCWAWQRYGMAVDFEHRKSGYRLFS